MFNSIALTTVRVLDQDEALDFYVGTLGFAVQDDVDMGFMRWLTIALPAQPQRQLLLELAGPPAMSEETAAQVRDLLTKGALGVAAILNTDDCQAVYDTLKARGVEFTQSVEQQPYGIDCAFRDPFGNHIRVTQPVEGPVTVSDADIARWGGAGPA
ncbi:MULTISPECIES: VOC family protein [Dactylosporangium]|uniref:Lyase n=2 Tax=Dactylosporangium TaxID=35753 RepID=A0A9W6KJT3_9ACTN|nr:MULTISPECIES: VOC family protein [Dactylosporangium]UAB99373.1 VOC family protein [Dactylosporangium vinaceum]UWZ47600.1 VOC family protein [Dactylosporangium matsuzakiense]GLL01566.1 lyase [Dactylosporangium matsuzakiense]